METKRRRRVRCAGCNRRMYQNAPANRDYRGRSWHNECLVNSVGSARHYTKIAGQLWGWTEGS
jgi:hypothetical protein